MSQLHYHHIEIHQEPLAEVADFLLRQAPDLSSIICILPNDYLLHELDLLLQQSGQSLLFPQFFTQAQYLNMRVPISQNVLAPELCQLYLSNILKEHRHLYGRGSAWHLAENLLQLFAEIGEQSLLENISYQQFLQNIAGDAAGYEWLGKEASLVHTLWQAWQQQMQAEGFLDKSAAYRQQLSLDCELANQAETIIYVVDNQLKKSEQNWLEMKSKQMQIEVFDFASANVDKPYKNHAYALQTQSFEDLAQAIAMLAKSSSKNKIKTLLIGADRKLSRRLQAIFSTENISCDDKSGWALSTTKVGALLENVFLAIEQDFHYRPFLNFLKANVDHFKLNTDLENRQLIYRFEQDILHANIASNLDDYKTATLSAAANFNKINANSDTTINKTHAAIIELLEQIQTASAFFVSAYKLQQQHDLEIYIENILHFLELVGALEFIEQDSAGQMLLNALQQSCDMVKHHRIFAKLSWREFRNWLHALLEGRYFRPAMSAAYVSMATFEQANYLQADICIICHCDAQHLPPAPTDSPFFNQASRRQLGLEGIVEMQARAQQNFCRQMARQPKMIFAWQNADENGGIAACTWLQRLQKGGLDLHPLTCINELLDKNQQRQVAMQNIYSADIDADIAPLLPTVISVTAHQRLISSPVDFYVRHILNLKTSDEITELLKSSDYGSMVHKILEALHKQIGKLPAPYNGEWSLQNKTIIFDTASKIAQAIFASDLKNNYEHKGWLQRFLNSLNEYINWEIDHQKQWQFKSAEERMDCKIMQNLNLRGSIDRIDKSKNQECEQFYLIDYKTGLLPTLARMRAGEDVQLASYALAFSSIEVCYLGIQNKSKSVSLAGDELAEMSEALRQRLQHIFSSLQTSDAKLHSHCASVPLSCLHPGICRCDAWA